MTKTIFLLSGQVFTLLQHVPFHLPSSFCPTWDHRCGQAGSGGGRREKRSGGHVSESGAARPGTADVTATVMAP